jgi:glycerol uptake facilitator-like aquaporin
MHNTLAGTGGKWTGAALNPARVIGPAAVFHCSQEVRCACGLAVL